MTDIDTLIRDLEGTSDSAERGAILNALTYAHASKWIDTATFHRAQKMLHVGAFLSAAMILVPEGWEWTVNEFCVGSNVRRCYARVANNGLRDDPSFFVDLYPTTPALTLCIAALKARSAA